MLVAVADSSWHTCPWEMGRADLEQRLIRLYQKANPSKISDAFSVSEEWYGNEEELRLMVKQRYNTLLEPPRSPLPSPANSAKW